MCAPCRCSSGLTSPSGPRGHPVYALYRPHGSLVAGVVVIAAGAYELTPLKQHIRRRCRDGVRVGSSSGSVASARASDLMLVLVALGVMSIAWMSVIALVVVAQKILSPKVAIDVLMALAIVGLGILIVMARPARRSRTASTAPSSTSRTTTSRSTRCRGRRTRSCRPPSSGWAGASSGPFRSTASSL